MKPSRVATIALAGVLSATMLTFSSASDAAVGTELNESTILDLFTPFGQVAPGGHIHADLN
ncbi:MAG: hypothetical protein ACKVG5_05165, partial [Acidimicrobiales bacterium]